MARKLLIDAAHKEETRVVVVDGDRVDEFDFETSSKKQIGGNIFLARIERVESALQAVFVEYGGNRHGFLAFSEIHPDYYHVPVSERESPEDEPASPAASEDSGDSEPEAGSKRQASANAAALQDRIAGMDVIDPAQETPANGGGSGEPGEIAPDPRSEEAPAGEADAAAPENGAQDGEAADASQPPESDPGAEQKLGRKFRIQEVMRARQILLVQVVKDERGNKGAALTTYISLAGRYCVLMPNATRGGGISRKITSSADRKKLESISEDFNLPKGAGLIIRTAGAKRTKQEIRRDYEYLLRQWDHIRELALTSYAPAPIYEEGGLIRRAVRDIYTKDIDSVDVQGDEGYRVAKDFMKLLMPSHAKKVRKYTDKVPLFVRHGVEPFLANLYSPIAQLPSGGYIVINSTEALTAIDVNSGKAIKHGTLEQTALETNMEAAAEVARQLRLRDLAGLIVIDFIDMEERQNNTAVEKHFKEMIKGDRAKVQIGRISSFGLLEMSRQRLRPSVAEMTSITCAACSGTGLVRSVESLSLTLLRQIESESTRISGGEIVAKVPVRVANFIMNRKRTALDHIESTYGVSLLIEAVPNATSPKLLIERQKSDRAHDFEEAEQVVSIETSLKAAHGEEDAEADGLQKPSSAKRKRRRGGRKRSRSGADSLGNAQDATAETVDVPSVGGESETPDQATKAKKPRGTGRSRRSGRKGRASSAPAAHAGDGQAADRKPASDADQQDQAGDNARGDGAAKADAIESAPDAAATETSAAQSGPGGGKAAATRAKRDGRRSSRGRRGKSNGARNRGKQDPAAETSRSDAAAESAGNGPSSPESIQAPPPAPPPQQAKPESPADVGPVPGASPVATPADASARTGWWSA